MPDETPTTWCGHCADWIEPLDEDACPFCGWPVEPGNTPYAEPELLEDR